MLRLARPGHNTFVNPRSGANVAKPNPGVYSISICRDRKRDPLAHGKGYTPNINKMTKTPKSDGVTWFCVLSLTVVLYAALVFNGANSAALAALLGALLCGLCALLLLLPQVSRSRDTPLSIHNRFALGLSGIFLLYILLSVIPNPLLPAHPAWALVPSAPGVASLSPYRTLEGLAGLAVPVGAFIAARLTVTSRAARRLFFRCLILLSGVYALYALALYAGGGGVTLDGRLAVNFGSANSAATLFYIAAILAFAGIIIEMQIPQPETTVSLGKGAGAFALGLIHAAPLSLAAFILNTTCLMLTASRAGLISGLIGFLIFGVILALMQKGTVTSQLRKGLLAGAGVLLILIAAGAQFAFRRFADTFEQTVAREKLLQAHWEAFLERPFLGHGLNTYAELNLLSVDTENWSYLLHAGAVHNIYLQALEEMGLVGTLLFGSIVLLALLPIFRRVLTEYRGSGPVWSAAAIAILIAVFVHGLVDFGLQTPAIAALVAAIAGALHTPLSPSPDRRAGSSTHRSSPKWSRPGGRPDTDDTSPIGRAYDQVG